MPLPGLQLTASSLQQCTCLDWSCTDRGSAAVHLPQLARALSFLPLRSSPTRGLLCCLAASPGVAGLPGPASRPAGLVAADTGMSGLDVTSTEGWWPAVLMMVAMF